jgi:N-acetylmuramoyl-L-alanine amidase
MNRKTRILIDPGHPSHNNPGAIHDGVAEAAVNLLVALCLGGKLAAAGFAVRYTRQDDHPVELEDRVQIEHLTEPDLFISLHCNSFSSPGVHGIEVFTSHGLTDADPAATCVCEWLQKSFPASDFRADFSDGDPDKEAHYYVLDNTNCPAILIEMGFLSNPAERAWLTDPETQDAIAEAICCGLIDWRDSRP